MKTLFVILLFGFMKVQAQVSNIPNSPRSKEAVERVLPLLKAEFKKKGLTWGERLFIRIFKEQKTLEIWVRKRSKFALLKSYPICYFSGNVGPKIKEGDNQAPEGFYEVRPAQMNPNSSYHLAFNLGYPNAYDLAHGYTGSYLMVHGNCVSIGCYAMTDDKIEEIYALMQAAFEHGQKAIQVHCFPFEMTDENLKKYKDHKYAAFWQNLQDGYQLFEQNHKPPKVNVKNKKYVFE